MITGLPLLMLILASLVFIIIACSVLKWHPFPVLVCTAVLLGLFAGMAPTSVIQTLSEGAGATFASIGIIIALGTILGEILERSRATHSLAHAIVKLWGKKRVLTGMGTLGGVVGIPVFCDSGFIILSNLGRSLSHQTGVSYGSISIALATGLYTTHVLIPPTPGPMAAAGNLGASDEIGLVIVFGLIVGIPAIMAGTWMAAKMKKDLPQPDMENNQAVQQQEPLPSLLRSAVPLLLPILLITFGSFLGFMSLPPTLLSTLKFLTSPMISLLLSVLLAFALLFPHKSSDVIAKALSQAGPIILITAAGGAFGAILKATPLAELFNSIITQTQVSRYGFFVAAFVLAAALKTAQGSSTASLIITSSFLAPLMSVMQVEDPIGKALLVLCIGAGAMTVSHANDSYFWVIQQYSGMEVKKMYRHFTLTTLVMGIVVLLGCMLLLTISEFIIQ